VLVLTQIPLWPLICELVARTDLVYAGPLVVPPRTVSPGVSGTRDLIFEFKNRAWLRAHGKITTRIRLRSPATITEENLEIVAWPSDEVVRGSIDRAGDYLQCEFTVPHTESKKLLAGKWFKVRIRLDKDAAANVDVPRTEVCFQSESHVGTRLPCGPLVVSRRRFSMSWHWLVALMICAVSTSFLLVYPALRRRARKQVTLDIAEQLLQGQITAQQLADSMK
jgi:hypothetical protein